MQGLANFISSRLVGWLSAGFCICVCVSDSVQAFQFIVFFFASCFYRTRESTSVYEGIIPNLATKQKTKQNDIKLASPKFMARLLSKHDYYITFMFLTFNRH